MCLHNAYKIKVVNGEDGTRLFLDVDRLPSNLFREDSHADICLDHYLHNRALLESTDKKWLHNCTCPSYIESLQKARLHGEKAPYRTIRAGLMAKV